MPLFDCVCERCGSRFTILIGVVAEDDDEKCPNCASEKIRRLPSRVQRGRSEDERLDELADRVEQMGEPETYRELRKQVRDAGAAMDDSAADEMEEMLETGDE